MSAYENLRLAKEEEKVLMRLAGKLNDQLNRLKVEELALLSDIRSAQDKVGQAQVKVEKFKEEDEDDEEEMNTQVLDLSVQKEGKSHVAEEEEEEEEEEEPEDDLTAFVKQLERQSST